MLHLVMTLNVCTMESMTLEWREVQWAKAIYLHVALTLPICYKAELTKANVRLYITSSLQWGMNVLLMELWRGTSILAKKQFRLKCRKAFSMCHLATETSEQHEFRLTMGKTHESLLIIFLWATIQVWRWRQPFWRLLIMHAWKFANISKIWAYSPFQFHPTFLFYTLYFFQVRFLFSTQVCAFTPPGFA